MSDVKLDIFGNSEKAQAALVALEKRLDTLEARTKRTGQSSRKSFGVFKQGTALAAAGVTVLVGVLKGLNDEQVRVRTEAEKTFAALQKSAIASAIQSGQFSKRAGSETLRRAFEISSRTGVDVESVLATAQSAESAGFSGAGTLKAGVTEEVLRALASTGRQVEATQAAGIAESLTSILNAQGLDLTKANVAAQLGRTRGLQQSTKVQFEDIQAQAQAASLASAAGISPTDFDAIFSVLRDTQTAEQASTGLNAVLTGVVGDKAGARQFRKALGLKAEDVDFVGETPIEVFDRINDALVKLDRPDQVRALEAIGKRAITPLQNLASAADSGKLQQRVQFAQGGAGLVDRGLGVALQTEAVAELRARNALRLEDVSDAEGRNFSDSETARQLAIQRSRKRRSRRIQDREGITGAALNLLDTGIGAVERVSQDYIGSNSSLGEDLEFIRNTQRTADAVEGLRRDVRGKVDRNGQR